MSAVFERLIQHFESRDLGFEADSERQILRAGFQGEVGVNRIVAWVHDDQDLLQVFGLAAVRVPEGARPAVAETITRANYGMKVGKFEMDFSDGELRYQASTVLVGGVLDDAAIERLIATVLHMLDRYLPAVMSVIYANEAPADAVRRVEADFRRVEAS